MNHRRTFLTRLAAAAGAFGASRGSGAAQLTGINLPVAMPDASKLPYQLVNGVKEFRLTAEVVQTEFVPGRPVTAWGFNGSVPGPTLEIDEGDRVRVIFENRLPEMTALHWHGFEVPMEMDGSVGLGQDPVPPGGTFVHEFTLNQHGTLFYHSHFAMQEMMGMLGMVVIHPKVPYTPAVDRDFGILLQEWAILPNNTVPNTMAMEFNWLTFNGKAGPACTPMIVKQGERVRIRLVNLGMDHHPIHLHGVQFVVTGTEGGRTPSSQWHDMNTVLVGVAQARNIEFEAKHLGDWMLHCHLPHHMMNQMVTMVGPVHQHGGADHYPKDDPEKKKIPGYPQDMWMPMDDMIPVKPEHDGLRKNWTGGMMGMMTMVRVVTPEKYARIEELRKAARA
jgi:FtsP/CotA-like multicopper oxidase with cupredoxin domain